MPCNEKPRPYRVFTPAISWTIAIAIARMIAIFSYWSLGIVYKRVRHPIHSAEKNQNHPRNCNHNSSINSRCEWTLNLILKQQLHESKTFKGTRTLRVNLHLRWVKLWQLWFRKWLRFFVEWTGIAITIGKIYMYRTHFWTIPILQTKRIAIVQLTASVNTPSVSPILFSTLFFGY